MTEKKAHYIIDDTRIIMRDYYHGQWHELAISAEQKDLESVLATGADYHNTRRALIQDQLDRELNNDKHTILPTNFVAGVGFKI